LGASSSIVIGQFRTRGPNGGSDEFIELYNLSSSAVDIGGWLVDGSNSSGTRSTRAIISPGTVPSPGCHYLLTNSNPTGGPYSGSVPGDQTYGVGITDDGGIAIKRPDGSVADEVGMSGGSAFKEGAPLAPLTSNSNVSYERRPGGQAGNGQDTDNNSLDFRLISPSNPRNRSIACASETSTGPSGVGGANPATVNSGSATLLTVSVSPGTNPSSTGLSVTGDLTGIGGPQVQQFFDDGTNGDAVPDDDVFSLRAAIAANTSTGVKALPIAISDAQSRTSGTSIALTVGPPAAQCGVERWSVKTGTDLNATAVDLNAVTPTTISAMRRWQAPALIPNDLRIAPYETTVWVINATLSQYKLETDSDYHVVLSDDSGSTIIAEIPCPCCVGSASPFGPDIAAVRSVFDAHLAATTVFQTANIPVQVTGVGMFDFLHGQTGVAANGIELHPVLGIAFDVDVRKPQIVGARIDGKRLLVSGLSFSDGAAILLDGDRQKTANDPDAPSTTLIGKKAGKFIARGQAVVLQVRNSDGTLSDGFPFTRPIQ